MVEVERLECNKLVGRFLIGALFLVAVTDNVELLLQTSRKSESQRGALCRTRSETGCAYNKETKSRFHASELR